MSVPGSLLLPTTNRSAPATTRSRSRSATSGATYTRWTDRQFCPAAPNAPLTMAPAALSTSASGSTMTAPLPPSSISVFLAPAARATASPVAYPPVNDTMSTSGWLTSAAPTVAPRPGSTASRPAGTPASSRSSTKASAVNGVCSAGLRTTAFPPIRAGASLCATRLSGSLKGVIAPITPTGSRVYQPTRPPPRGVSPKGRVAPSRRSACSAERRTVSTALCASRPASRTGLQPSREIRCAKSSRRSVSRAAARLNASRRCQSGHASSSMRERETARTAASTSAAEQSETVPTTVPFSGSRTSRRTVGGRHEPAQKAPPGGIQSRVESSVMTSL